MTLCNLSEWWLCDNHGSNYLYCDCEMRSIFSLLQCQKNLILLFLQYETLCKTQKNTCEIHLYCCDHFCKVN